MTPATGETDRHYVQRCLDGLHAGYVPEGRVMAEGGTIDQADLEPFVTLARRAAAGEIVLVVTHSEIFPGTFARTTETTDALLTALGLKRTAVLTWGPLGIQQLSEASRRRFTVLGFAGNTAPDHIDHLHALPRFAELLATARREQRPQGRVRGPCRPLPTPLPPAEPSSRRRVCLRG